MTIVVWVLAMVFIMYFLWCALGFAACDLLKLYSLKK